MNDKKEKNFYWSTGVTRNEVIQSLNDNSHSVLRTQSNRRKLVVFTTLVLFVMAFTTYIPQPKFRSYLDIVLIAYVLWAHFQLRKSVRNVADAPDELLDERQIAVRNSGYLHAYRYLAGIGIFYVFFYFFNTTELFQSIFGVPSHNFSQMVFSFCMWTACLPSMVLAWLLPSENLNESQ
jgi:hypothetical protein